MASISSQGGRFREPQSVTQSLAHVSVSYSGAMLPVNALNPRQQQARENLPDLHEQLLNIVSQLLGSLDDGQGQGQGQGKGETRMDKYSFNTYRRCFLLRDVVRLVRIEIRNGREVSVSFADMEPVSGGDAACCNISPPPQFESK